MSFYSQENLEVTQTQERTVIVVYSCQMFTPIKGFVSGLLLVRCVRYSHFLQLCNVPI